MKIEKIAPELSNLGSGPHGAESFMKIVQNGPEGSKKIEGPVIVSEPATTVNPGSVVIYDVNSHKLVSKTPGSIGIA